MKKYLFLIEIIIITFLLIGCWLFDSSPPETPKFSHSGNVVYYETIHVEIRGEENGILYYTTDGSEPSDVSNEYVSPITISSDTVLKAICIDAAGNISQSTSAEYYFDTDAGVPVISLDSGIFPNNQIITITLDDNTSVFYTYTETGSEPENPTNEALEYKDHIHISADENTSKTYKYKFIAITTAQSETLTRSATESEIIERTYTIDKKPPSAPKFSHPDDVRYENIIHIEILDEESGTIYYTTDGSEPSDMSNKYIARIIISSNTVLKAICQDTVGNISRTTTAEYKVYTSSQANSYLDVASGKIYNVSSSCEYSLDNKASWIDCESSVVDVTFSVGDEVWVFDNSDYTIQYLGKVESVDSPDIMPLNIYAGVNWFSDRDYGYVGDNISLLVDIRNIGNQALNQSGIDIKFYLSEDKIIDAADTLLLNDNATLDLVNEETVTIGYQNITIPPVESGTYFIGCIIDVNNEVSELTHGNNTIIPKYVDEFHVLDSSLVTRGAIKIVNSWGTGSWENKPDGHYWVTYETAKSLNMSVRYYYNDFSHVYEPTIIATFNISHLHRDQCHIVFGLGDPDNPIMEKEFQSRWGSSYYAGSEPFPDNTIALDISEFAPYINEYDLFLRTDTSSSSDNGVLNNFAVEFYSDYDEEAFKIISGETGGFSSNMQTDFLAPTANSLSAEEHNSVIPLDRASPDQMGFIEEYPGVEELAHDMDIIGVYEEGKNYNIIVDSKYGTGDIPPTIEQWKTMVKLRAVDNKRKFGILPNEVDHSETQYFPPVGNQGREGSCVAFTFGYYIQTYTEAREHNWDLSGTSWGGDWPGYPLSNLDKIISPDFLYHQINGGSPGANGTVAASFINRIGGSSWQEMPYSDDEESGESPYFYNWPSESAYREAAQYRGRETNPTYWSYNTSGYFVITSDAEITLLKELLAAGYCVYVSVEAAALYNLFDSNDVVTGYSSGAMSTNHANTIVGYKEGSAWDLDNPDD